MEVETTRHYNDGFVLTEQSLRRLLDVIKEQIHKLGDARAIATRLKFRFLNGAIATSDSIEDLFKQENGGQAQIVDLNIEFKEDPGNDPIVSIRFSNPRVNLGRSSISVEIRGDSRDLVFVTGSLIDERIQQTKRSTLLTELAT